MAARGSVLKQEIMDKILATFPNSFSYNDGKEIRINGTENGETLQIKVTFTCSKTVVENEKSSTITSAGSTLEDNDIVQISSDTPLEPSKEEKERLATLLEKLGL